MTDDLLFDNNEQLFVAEILLSTFRFVMKLCRSCPDVDCGRPWS
jgi:hypothetical protein